jgi:hypothetical protein
MIYTTLYRRTETTMAKRQKGKTMIYTTLHRTATTMAKRQKGQTMIYSLLAIVVAVLCSVV